LPNNFVLSSFDFISDIGNAVIWLKEKGKVQADTHHGNIFRLQPDHWALGDGSLFGEYTDEAYRLQIKKMVLSILRILIVREDDAKERQEACKIIGDRAGGALLEDSEIVAKRVSNLLDLKLQEALMLVRLYRFEISLEEAVEVR
jgi:hypothetical protein